MPKVSICIPTYKRPDLLKVALDSCLAQTFQDFEVVIVDDSPDVLTENMIRNMRATRAIEYVRNAHRTGQANSKNQLFDLATAEFIVMLHDDNILTPTALDDLIKPLQEHSAVVASFGKQYCLTNEGSILEGETAMMNKRYFRTDDRGDQVQQSEWSALVQQFPGDGFMIRSVVARKTRYRESERPNRGRPGHGGDPVSVRTRRKRGAGESKGVAHYSAV